MPSIHDIPEDDPNVPASNIVGTFYKDGRVFYQGRPQGSKCWAESEPELIRLLTAKQREIIKECGEAADWIYPDNNAWEIRIFYP